MELSICYVSLYTIYIFGIRITECDERYHCFFFFHECKRGVPCAIRFRRNREIGINSSHICKLEGGAEDTCVASVASVASFCIVAGVC